MRTGVIIGRFQVPELTVGHRALIQQAIMNFDALGFLVGATKRPDRNNPLSFIMRQSMLSDYCPAFIRQIMDVPGDDLTWSHLVDDTVASVAQGEVYLVGGRDSFIPSYKGRYPTVSYPVWVGPTGTQVREKVAAVTVNSPDFRKGVIWAISNHLERGYGV